MAKGQPIAWTAFCACFCRPSREIVKAGNATTDFALLTRSAMTAIAFSNAASFRRVVPRRSSSAATLTRQSRVHVFAKVSGFVDNGRQEAPDKSRLDQMLDDSFSSALFASWLPDTRAMP